MWITIFFDTETNGLWRRDLPYDHKDQARLVSMAFQVCDDNTHKNYSSISTVG